MDERQARRARLHKEAERRWEKLGREHPELEDTIAFGRGLVARYVDDLPRAADVALTPEEARAKLAVGMPLLEDQDLGLDLPGIRRFFREATRLSFQTGTRRTISRMKACVGPSTVLIAAISSSVSSPSAPGRSSS